MYLSKINISNKFFDSANLNEAQSEQFIRNKFDDFCSKKNFSHQKDDLLLVKGTEVISQCGKAWFYNARLWKKPDIYEIELFLMQPWPKKKKAETFICSETKEMFDFFRTSFGQANISLYPYSGCKL